MLYKCYTNVLWLNDFCITFVQRRPNVFDVGPTLYKCYTNVLCLLDCYVVLQDILQYARHDAKKALFLITDGYSNNGDPTWAAKQLREKGVEIFTFGIVRGNFKELCHMASEPKIKHTYILDSFEEFEALARRALHEGQ